jgi:hypothetical protein
MEAERDELFVDEPVDADVRDRSSVRARDDDLRMIRIELDCGSEIRLREGPIADAQILRRLV